MSDSLAAERARRRAEEAPNWLTRHAERSREHDAERARNRPAPPPPRDRAVIEADLTAAREALQAFRDSCEIVDFSQPGQQRIYPEHQPEYGPLASRVNSLQDELLHALQRDGTPRLEVEHLAGKMRRV